jgi:hypothetical protein
MSRVGIVDFGLSKFVKLASPLTFNKGDAVFNNFFFLLCFEKKLNLNLDTLIIGFYLFRKKKLFLKFLFTGYNVYNCKFYECCKNKY